MEHVPLTKLRRSRVSLRLLDKAIRAYDNFTKKEEDKRLVEEFRDACSKPRSRQIESGRQPKVYES